MWQLQTGLTLITEMHLKDHNIENDIINLVNLDTCKHLNLTIDDLTHIYHFNSADGVEDCEYM